MKYQFFFALLPILISFQNLNAQDKSEIIPSEINQTDINIGQFCKPGVRNKSRSKGLSIDYRLLGKAKYNELRTSLSDPKSSYDKVQKFGADIKIPIINKDRFKFIIGYNFYLERFDFQKIGVDFTESFKALENTPLKRNSFSLFAVKPMQNKSYLVFRFRNLFVGNYEGWFNFEKDNMLFNADAVYVKKPSEDLEWGFGLHVTQNFRWTLAIPIFIYNKNFNKHWGVESALPSFIYGRYNINGKQILIFGAKYESDSYKIKSISATHDLLNFAFKHSEVVNSIQLQQQLSSWIWANFELGYQANISTDFRKYQLDHPDLRVHPNNALYIKVGLFLSPPDKLVN